MPFPEVEKGAEVVDPASIPLPAADDAENAALEWGNGKGSEDFIVHDSEGDEDDYLSPREERDVAVGGGERFAFGSYAYAG